MTDVLILLLCGVAASQPPIRNREWGISSRQVLDVITPHVPAATPRAWREQAATNYAWHRATESAVEHHVCWSVLRK